MRYDDHVCFFRLNLFLDLTSEAVGVAERKLNLEAAGRQGIGQLVEQLLRDQLEARGLRVERTGIGSDFEVECDFVEVPA